MQQSIVIVLNFHYLCFSQRKQNRYHKIRHHFRTRSFLECRGLSQTLSKYAPKNIPTWLVQYPNNFVAYTFPLLSILNNPLKSQPIIPFQISVFLYQFNKPKHDSHIYYILQQLMFGGWNMLKYTGYILQRCIFFPCYFCQGPGSLYTIIYIYVSKFKS